MDRKVTILFVVCFMIWGIASAQPSADRLIQEIERLKDNHPDSAIILAKRLKQEFPKKKYQSRANIELAYAYLSQRDTETAEQLLKEAEAGFKEIGGNDGLSQTYLVSGLLHFAIGSQEEALRYYYKSIEISERPSPNHYKTYGHIARILQNNRDAKNALKYHQLSLDGAEEQNDWTAYVRTCMNMCILYNGKATTNIDSSAFYGKRAIQICEREGFDRLRAFAVNFTAAPVIRQGNYQEGINMSREAQRLAKIYPMPKASDYIQYINLSFAYLGLEDLRQAKLMLDSAEILRPGASDLWRLKYRIAKADGKIEAALEFLEIYKSKHDSVNSANYEQQFSKMQSRLEADQKTQEVNDLKRETQIKELQISQQRNTIIISILIILVILIGGVFYFKWNKAQKEKAISDLQEKLLRTQMNPHFLFNSMGAIQDYMLNQDTARAGHYLGMFSTLMRQILDHSRSDFIPLKEEVSMLSNYLELQKMRFKDQFNFEIIVDEEIDKNYIGIPPLFAQPFVENSLEHGLFLKESQNLIQVRFEMLTETSVKIQIVDSGVGMVEKETTSKHISHATNITKERISMYRNLVKDQVEILIENVKNASGQIDGLSVNIVLPAKVILHR